MDGQNKKIDKHEDLQRNDGRTMTWTSEKIAYRLRQIDSLIKGLKADKQINKNEGCINIWIR